MAQRFPRSLPGVRSPRLCISPSPTARSRLVRFLSHHGQLRQAGYTASLAESRSPKFRWCSHANVCSHSCQDLDRAGGSKGQCFRGGLPLRIFVSSSPLSAASAAQGIPSTRAEGDTPRVWARRTTGVEHGSSSSSRSTRSGSCDSRLLGKLPLCQVPDLPQSHQVFGHSLHDRLWVEDEVTLIVGIDPLNCPLRWDRIDDPITAIRRLPLQKSRTSSAMVYLQADRHLTIRASLGSRLPRSSSEISSVDRRTLLARLG